MKKKTIDLDLAFVDRVIKTTLIAAFIASLFLIVYIDFGFALSVLIGAIWSVLNLFAIKLVITSMLIKEKKNTNKKARGHKFDDHIPWSDKHLASSASAAKKEP